ncbi:MAG: metal-dependent hydrolase [Deltaproteobacteria bacterium]|nr:metal-dependent hydrolase [Deltaproteobacteria bacterium]
MAIDKITYAGHSAVFIHAGDVVAAIDPWLEGNPRCPKKLINPNKLDLIVLTHGHSDHAGDVLRLAKQFGCTVAATFELAMLLVEEGVPQTNVLAMNKGGSMQHGDLKISLTNAFHSSSYETSSGSRYAGEACGVVLSDEKQSIYHAGDTLLFSDMSLIRDLYRPAVALLPIGDRFTMGPREAALALQVIGAKTAVPIHFGTFDMLTGTAEQFKRECSAISELNDVEIAVLEPGQELKL